MHKPHVVWGQWDGSSPRFVLAKGPGSMFQEEAKKFLEKMEEDYVAVPQGDEPVYVVVQDCPFDEPAPCDDPKCRHEHKEWV